MAAREQLSKVHGATAELGGPGETGWGVVGWGSVRVHMLGPAAREDGPEFELGGRFHRQVDRVRLVPLSPISAQRALPQLQPESQDLSLLHPRLFLVRGSNLAAQIRPQRRPRSTSFSGSRISFVTSHFTFLSPVKKSLDFSLFLQIGFSAPQGCGKTTLVFALDYLFRLSGRYVRVLLQKIWNFFFFKV